MVEPSKSSGELPTASEEVRATVLVHVSRAMLWLAILFLSLACTATWIDQFRPFRVSASFLVPWLAGSGGLLFGLIALKSLLRFGRRQHLMEVIAGVNLLAALALFLPIWWGSLVPVGEKDSTAPTIRVMTANLWNNYRAVPQFVELVRSERPDLVFIQEGYEPWRSVIERELPEYQRAAGCEHRHTCNTVVYQRGFTQRLIEGDGKGFAAAEVSLKSDVMGGAITLVSAHISRSRLQRAQEELTALSKELSGRSGPIIVAGDFNMSPWDSRFRRLQDQFGLRLYSGLESSWPTHSRLDLQRRWLPIPGVSIDHVLASEHFRRVGQPQRRDFGSDHFAVIVDLEVHSN